ncbi:MAG: trypsin-like peptidase domain-containing protein [Oscillospiraceae bacterium]|nr:trypsin-like peptidase domain-containing protein [Oscillospiraceae bacterium]
MFDRDDIRYSRAETRPPWELSTSSHLKEMFSGHHHVDEINSPPCDEVDRHKEARIQAQSARKLAHEQAQARRSAAQARMRSSLHSTSDGDSNDDLDELGPYEWMRRYAAEQEKAQSNQPPTPPSRTLSIRKTSRGAIVIIVIALIASALIQAIYLNIGTEEEDFSAMEPDPDSGWFEDLPEDEDFYEGYFSPELEREDYPEVSHQELPRAPLAPGMGIEIVSHQGLAPLTYQQLYAKCAPSTVSITVYGQDTVGTGTGIVMTEDGYILTCQHVIDDGVTCQVMTWDDQVYEATLVGADVQTDLAVLKIEATGLTPAQFGDSDELTVGDEALAIGDPLGTELRGTLTNGIISAINRNVTVSGYSMTLLQTTAALNSGNSGGPLLNIYGQVVGVNNMKMNSTDVTVEGLGFAVPTSVVREIAPALFSDGKISRPVLGITCYSINEEAAESYGYPSAGLVVATVHQGSDCYQQGLQVEDMVWAINGVPVSDVSQVKPILEQVGLEGSVILSVYRFEDPSDPSVYEEFELIVQLVDQVSIS